MNKEAKMLLEFFVINIAIALIILVIFYGLVGIWLWPVLVPNTVLAIKFLIDFIKELQKKEKANE